MSRYPGGIIRKTPVTPAGPFQNGAAPGMWTLAEASFWTKQGLWPIAGNIQPVVEDVFSTYLYTGNSSTQTITNGIDLAGKGGLVWIKNRTTSTYDHYVVDTVTGNLSYALATNATRGKTFDFTPYSYVSSLNSNGFSLAVGAGDKNDVNASGQSYVSWTFREAPNFFDVVTYTGNGANRTIAHNLGSVPGMILVKRTDTTGDWQVYHRSLANTQYTVLNTNAAVATGATRWNSTTPTATEFSVGTDATVNASGGTYVAYLFAHDAGGFGPTGTDNIISCGSFTTDASRNFSINLGWEPQWILHKAVSTTSGWNIFDTMRQWDANQKALQLLANTTQVDFGPVNTGAPTATGVLKTGGGTAEIANTTYIYMAIRRGPMRTPTLGTSVFSPVLQSPQSGGTVRTVGFPADFILGTARGGGINRLENTKLTGFANTSGASINTPGMFTNTTDAESNQYPLFYDVWNTTARDGDYLYLSNNINYFFRRAPGFFDVVCYTGTGVARTVNHSLGVTPELMIMKNRSSAGYSWFTWDKSADLSQAFALLALNNTAGRPAFSSGNLNSTVPTSTVFTVGGDSNASGNNYVAYLFASVPGVSKVGSYTGNGSSQTINCAFTTGARFVMIKRTNAAGDWYVWDSARGIVAGNDPYLALNDTAAEVTTNDSVDTDSTGFVVNQVAASNINVSAATYIFLAIA